MRLSKRLSLAPRRMQIQRIMDKEWVLTTVHVPQSIPVVTGIEITPRRLSI
jgi:hypothetical protein